MRCETCNKEMVFFKTGLTCGWKCNSCDSHIVTTFNNELELDETMYSIVITPNNSTSAINIKYLSQVCRCSFLVAKEYLTTGKKLDEHNAVETNDMIQLLKQTDIQFHSFDRNRM